MFGTMFAVYSNAAAGNDIKRFRVEIENLDIPSAAEDRKNLKSDRDAIAQDYKKAYEEKKLQLSSN